MTDLLLINPNGREGIYQHLASDLAAVEPPLWCRLIAGYCLDRGHSVKIIDAEAMRLSATEVATRVREIAPRLVVVVAAGHQPSASTQNMPAAGAVCRAVKAASRVPVVLLGGHVSALPARTMDEEACDFACVGEGPVTVAGLLKNAGDVMLTGVPGLVWRDGNEVVINRRAPMLDLAELHGNAWHLLPMDRYRAHNWQCFDGSPRQPYASIYTSLGCPYSCSFCCINAPFGANRYRMREPAAVIAEVKHLHDVYGVTTFKITDEMFVLNRKHVAEICEGLAALPFADELNIWAYARVDTIEPGMLARMRSAGIRWLALGIESADEGVRDGALKPLNGAAIRTVVRLIQAAGINVLGNFIIGLPNDTHESVAATVDLALELRCEYTNFYSGMAYPGSALYDQAVADGRQLPATWAGYAQHGYDCTPLPTATLSSAEILAYRDAAFQRVFADPPYLDHVLEWFGFAALDEIGRMTKNRLSRRLLEPVAVSA